MSNDLKKLLAQWREPFPNLYLRSMRGDCAVKVVRVPVASYSPSPEALEASDAAFVAALQQEFSTADFLTEFAELAEEAGMDDVAEELTVAAEKSKPKKERKPRKSAKRKTDPDNFPL